MRYHSFYQTSSAKKIAKDFCVLAFLVMKTATKIIVPLAFDLPCCHQEVRSVARQLSGWKVTEIVRFSVCR